MINTDTTEKVIKFVIYSIIFFGTHFRTPATKKWNLFNSCVCLNETSWKFPEGTFSSTVFFGDNQSAWKDTAGRNTEKKKSKNRAKIGMKLGFPEGEEKQPWSRQIFFSMNTTLFYPTTAVMPQIFKATDVHSCVTGQPK